MLFDDDNDISVRFDFGKNVYAVLGPNRYCMGQVTAYRAWVIDEKSTLDGRNIIPTSVRLDVFTMTDYFSDIESDSVPFRYLTDNEEEAKRWSVFHPIDTTDEEWMMAIGRRSTFEEMKKAVENKDVEPNESIEESELGVCCGNISAIRDTLTKCWKNKGLIGREVELLQQQIDNSTHDFPENAPTLRRILNILNIVWK